MRHQTLLALVLLAPALACGAPEAGAAQDRDGEVARVAGGEEWETDFSKRSVPLSEIVSGGPPKDAIPAIDDPRFESPERADRWLEDRDPVMAVETGGETKLYPLAILTWHEIVNDRVGGVPVAVTYCPLCNTALAFRRRVDGRVLDFGTTGRLRHSDLVMYDRQTESWWQQASGEAIIGELMGTVLEFLSATVVSWKQARTLHPDARVLSRDTGYNRDYGRNPYAGYDRRRTPMAGFFSKKPDPRLPAMERVAALEVGGTAWAAPFDALREERTANVTVGGTPIAVLWAPGVASALDESDISEGRDVGSTAAFDRRVGDRALTLRWRDGAFRDAETGSTWNLAGRAVEGPLEGEQLEAIPHGNPFWFAWAAFQPETEVWRPGDGEG